MVQEFINDIMFLRLFLGHRFDIPKGKRRFSVKSKVSVVSAGSSRKSSVLPQSFPIYGYKKVFDHSPHKVKLY